MPTIEEELKKHLQQNNPPPGSNDRGGGSTPASGGNAGHYFYHGKCPKNRDALDVTHHDYGQSLTGRSMAGFLGAGDARLGRIRFNGVEHGELFDARQWHGAGAFSYFELKTIYPGVVSGSGYSHPAFDRGDNEPCDFQIGFFFDWTTGLPVIPGSTVKGVLRSVFPKEKDSSEAREQKQAYLCGLLNGIHKDAVPETKEFVQELEKQIFLERNRDRPPSIFYDAYITAADSEGCVFEEDYITPHGGPGRDDPFKDPIPLRFLKIGPDVTFRFQFRLHPFEAEGLRIKPGHQKTFFKQILLDFGVGAKRNTGYGMLVEENG